MVKKQREYVDKDHRVMKVYYDYVKNTMVEMQNQ